MHLPTREDVVAAAQRIGAYAVRTPLIRSDVLDALTGARVLLKLETLQRVGAFKFRGAYNAIAQISPAMAPGGIVACSSGNHAQGVAAAARLCGHRATIVMPHDAPRLKVARTRELGATVIGYDREREDRDAIALGIAQRDGAAFVPPFDHRDIIAGQGTVGLEISQQAAELGLPPDAILVPCSGGGLVTGVALGAGGDGHWPEVIAIEPAGFDDFGQSLAAGAIVRNPRLSGSICDALMAPQPGALTFALARHLDVKALAIDDAMTRAAMRFAFRELKLVVEPGGAIALAAVLARALPLAGRTIAVVLSGGNVDPSDFAAIITSEAEPGP